MVIILHDDYIKHDDDDEEEEMNETNDIKILITKKM